MVSSLCPGCGSHAVNLITYICYECGDRWAGVWDHIELLRGMFEEVGPLRDALLIMVVENQREYPTGCVCGNEIHGSTCPASKDGERYLEHLYRRPAQKDEEATKDNIDSDVRTHCPECGMQMRLDGGYSVCDPCGVRLVTDVSDASPPGSTDIEVWHCPKCDQCYTFKRLDLFPDAVVLAGDSVAPTTCYRCNGKLEQWACYRPLSAAQLFKLAGRALDGSLLKCGNSKDAPRD